MGYSEDFITAWEEKRYQDAKEIALKVGGNLFKMRTRSEWNKPISDWLNNELKNNQNPEELTSIRVVFQELSSIPHYKESCEDYIQFLEQKQFVISFQSINYILPEKIELSAKRSVFLLEIIELVRIAILKLTKPHELLKVRTLLLENAQNLAWKQSCKELLLIVEQQTLAMMQQLNVELENERKKSANLEAQLAAEIGKSTQLEQQRALFLDALEQASNREDHLPKKLDEQVIAITQLQASGAHSAPLLNLYISEKNQPKTSSTPENMRVDGNTEQKFTHH
jgi:hypothetical protein